MNVRTRRIRIGKEKVNIMTTEEGNKFYKGSFASSADISTDLVKNQRYIKEVGSSYSKTNK